MVEARRSLVNLFFETGPSLSPDVSDLPSFKESFARPLEGHIEARFSGYSRGTRRTRYKGSIRVLYRFRVS